MVDVSNFHLQPSPLDKGLGILPATGAIPSWNLLAEELSLPVAVLYEQKLAHNLAWMQGFMDAYGLKLAPHGKTTMAPKLFQRQLDGGAWGITVATAQQALVAFRHDVPRVLMANQLVGRRNLELVSEMLTEGQDRFSFFCLVDSPDAVSLLGRFFEARRQSIEVLLEVGPAGGRTGVRDATQEAAVLSALQTWRKTVRLAGVELFEGVLKEEAEIRALLRRAVGLLGQLVQGGHIQRNPPILTGAGSAWYDVVAEEFSKAAKPVELVLRPGCYLTHDVGIYRTAQALIEARNPVAQRMRGGLLPAMHLWAYIHSIPEISKGIVGLGKRDAAFDAGYPEPARHFRPGLHDAPQPAPPHWKLTALMDQHAYLQIEASDDLRVGDMLAFDISHPCLTYDKWRQIPVLDGEYRVIDLIQTYF